MSKFNFKKFAQENCNGCDLITTKENKLSTDEIVEACVKYGKLSIRDFAQVEIDTDSVGVVVFEEIQDKYYWGGKSITEMVNAIIKEFGSETKARAEYADVLADGGEHIEIVVEKTKTTNNRDFTKITVV